MAEGLPLVLASASPRRRELLEKAGLRFEVAPADVDERLEGFADPEAAARELAVRKARAGAARWKEVPREADERTCGACVLGADTIVAVASGRAWELLGKPEDARDAARMLGRLSGTRHLVVTGVAVVRTDDGRALVGAERTWVRMRTITEAERAAYVVSGEWRGKAGGYAIQESADRFVIELEEGGFDNVVGLPVALALSLIRAACQARA